MDLQKYQKNGLAAGNRVIQVPASLPLSQGRQTPYFAGATRKYLQNYAQYADNFFAAEIQGMDPENPMDTAWYRIRVEDIIGNSVAGTNMYDGWKMIFFENPEVEVLPKGVKLWFAGSCWLSINPDNIGSPVANGVIRKCDSVWGKLDYYGNAVYVPFVRDKAPTRANDNSETEYIILAKNYYNCIMAADENSADLRENTRIILGSSAYTVTGLNDSSRSYTDDPNSVALLYFSLYRQEPNDTDDMTRQIAGANAFSWEISIGGSRTMTAGKTQTLTASSLRCGEAPDPAQEISYTWSSSNEEAATVDGTGKVTAVAAGSTVITCQLTQNPNISQTMTLEVSEASASPVMAFMTPPPQTLEQYQTVTLTADVFENGAPTGASVTYTCTGPSDNCFTATVNEDGGLDITCYFPSYTPLTVTAVSGDLQISADILLTAL